MSPRCTLLQGAQCKLQLTSARRHIMYFSPCNAQSEPAPPGQKRGLWTCALSSPAEPLSVWSSTDRDRRHIRTGRPGSHGLEREMLCHQRSKYRKKYKTTTRKKYGKRKGKEREIPSQLVRSRMSVSSHTFSSWHQREHLPSWYASPLYQARKTRTAGGRSFLVQHKQGKEAPTHFALLLETPAPYARSRG